LEYYDQLKFGMIMGDQCELIVRTAKIWVPEIKDKINNEFIKTNGKIMQDISDEIRISDDEVILWQHFETLLSISILLFATQSMYSRNTNQHVLLQTNPQKAHIPVIDKFEMQYQPRKVSNKKFTLQLKCFHIASE